jgi:hypothetical protein
MKPAANALDILQAHRNCYLGILLPTLISLRSKLINLRNEVKYATPLANAVLDGIERRFASWFDDEDLILAAVTLPQFRLRWCSDDESKEKAHQLLKREMNRVSMASLASVNANASIAAQLSSEDTDEEFFSFGGASVQQNSIQQEMELYVTDEAKLLDSLKKFPTVKQAFHRYNTAIPSSAPVE